jgi:ribose transport system permease protein
MSRRIDLRRYAWPALGAFVVLFLANVAANPVFVSPDDWRPVMLGAAPFILTALAQAPPVLAGNGGIDLSIGPLAGFVNAFVASFLYGHGITDPAAVILIALGIGVASGLLNGVLVTVLRIQPIIATLGTFLVYQGLTLEVLPMAGGGAAPWLKALSGSVGGIPVVFLLLLVIAALWLLLGLTAYKRNLLAVGGDIRAAYTAGVNVAAVRIIAFVIAGVLAAVTGLVFTAALGSADPAIGTPYILTSVAAVALGGVSLAGGRGGFLGAAAGGAILFLIENLFSLAQVSVYYIELAYGVILIAALALNGLSERLGARRA